MDDLLAEINSCIRHMRSAASLVVMKRSIPAQQNKGHVSDKISNSIEQWKELHHVDGGVDNVASLVCDGVRNSSKAQDTELSKQSLGLSKSDDPSVSSVSPVISSATRQQLPRTLINLYSQMGHDGISFVGRAEVTHSDAKYINSFNLARGDDGSTDDTNGVTGASGDDAREKCLTSSCHSNEERIKSLFPSASDRAKATTLTPVCFCHLNPIERITEVTVIPDRPLSDDGRPEREIAGKKCQQRNTECNPSQQQHLDEKTPKEKYFYRYFLLCSPYEGSVPAHRTCVMEDGADIGILLRFKYSNSNGTANTNGTPSGRSDNEEVVTIPEVWGIHRPINDGGNVRNKYTTTSGIKRPECVSFIASVLFNDGTTSSNHKGVNKENESHSRWQFFFISSTLRDYMRLGSVRFFWVRGWQLLFSDVACAAFLRSEMALWLELISPGASQWTLRHLY
eukprot:Tbor_TRINITY_DN4089_c1_g1::TRINITY_DN4089_c1_g1_i1::g.11795::m.11795